MAALSADLYQERINAGKTLPYLMGTDIVYAGGIVHVTSAGVAVAGADTSGNKMVGVAVKQTDNSAGASNVYCEVWDEGVFTFTYTDASAAVVGALVYCADDQTVSLVGTTTNDVIVGKIVEVISATSVRVKIVTDL